MKIKVFLDTNIFVDVLVRTRPSSTASGLIFESVKEGSIEAALSTQSIMDAAYSLRGQVGQGEFYRFTEWVLNHVNMEYINTFDIHRAIADNSGDFEDDAHFSRALDAMCDYFITSDKRFLAKHKNSSERIKVVTPEEFVSKMRES